MISRNGRIAGLLLVAALLLPSSAIAQRFWDTPAGGAQVGGAVTMCLNGAGKAVPCSASAPATVGIAAQATGGCTLGKRLSTASTNAVSVKGSAGTLCSLTVINTTAVLYYLKFYDKATAATCNSDTVIQTIPIPASTTGAGVAVPVGPYGWAFPTGITFCLTGAIADNDNTNAATGVAINYSFK